MEPEASVLALFEILIDKNETVQNRLEAAQQILAYEAPAKALAEAKCYLTEVISNRSLAASLRLQATKLMRKSEARKVTKPPVQPPEDLAGRLERARKRLADRRFGEGS
jgi:hypothetical protein